MPAVCDGGQNRTQRLAGKKFPPLEPLRFLPARRRKLARRLSTGEGIDISVRIEYPYKYKRYL
ncbi:hypothetical protein CO122_02420 [bacterium (Candidatus Gribaldobacteria) CG_4_9_14_3_um_filter_33_9]|nr:MAG: hypothetical protein CO122_02420 [bacterium (Candidatus Gribaldobacteria) CG_4_9_14_3_um_filter_33_9]